MNAKETTNQKLAASHIYIYQKLFASQRSVAMIQMIQYLTYFKKFLNYCMKCFIIVNTNPSSVYSFINIVISKLSTINIDLL